MSIMEVTRVSFGSLKRPYTTKSQGNATINQIFKTPTELQIIRLLSIFVQIRSFRFLVFLHSTKINLLKSYEKCFLFQLNGSFGTCNIRILEGNYKVKKWNNYDISKWIAYITNFNFW